MIDGLLAGPLPESVRTFDRSAPRGRPGGRGGARDRDPTLKKGGDPTELAVERVMADAGVQASASKDALSSRRRSHGTPSLRRSGFATSCPGAAIGAHDGRREARDRALAVGAVAESVSRGIALVTDALLGAARVSVRGASVCSSPGWQVPPVPACSEESSPGEPTLARRRGHLLHRLLGEHRPDAGMHLVGVRVRTPPADAGRPAVARPVRGARRLDPDPRPRLPARRSSIGGGGRSRTSWPVPS